MPLDVAVDQPNPAHHLGSASTAHPAFDPYALPIPTAHPPAPPPPAPASPAATATDRARRPPKRLRKTQQEKADFAARKAIRRPEPVPALEGEDEAVLARLREMTPDKVRALQADLQRQEGLYAEAYAQLAAELKRAQVEEAVLANVMKAHTEGHARAEYEAVARAVGGAAAEDSL